MLLFPSDHCKMPRGMKSTSLASLTEGPPAQASHTDLFKEDMASMKSLKRQNSMTAMTAPSQLEVATIAGRCTYAKLVERYIKRVPHCLVADTRGVFHMGDKIALSKRIGSDSKYGIAYLAEGTGMGTGTIIKVAAKVIRNRSKDTGNRMEVSILGVMSRKVCSGFPNFPLMYAVLQCNQAVCEDNQDCHMLFKDKHMVVLNEIAVGDLSMWLRAPRKSSQCYSAIAHIAIALMAFNELGFVHNDMHWGNFLFHDVPAGGCWHYVIDGEDIYVENTGQLWVLWDFGMATKYTAYSRGAYKDYTRIMHAFVPSSSGGWLKKRGVVSPSVSQFALSFIDKLTTDIRYHAKQPVYNMMKDLKWLHRKVGKVLNSKPYVINTNKLTY